MRISFNGEKYFVLGRAGWGPLDPAELPEGIANLNAGELYDTETGKRSRYQNGQWIEVETQESTATPDVLVSGGPQPQPSAKPPELQPPAKPPGDDTWPQYFDANGKRLPSATGAATQMNKDGTEIKLGGTTGGPTMPTNPFTTGLTPDELRSQIAPEAVFQKQYGLPVFGLDPYQKWLQSQYEPMATTYLARARLGQQPPAEGQTATPVPSFADYLRSTNIGTARQAAPGLLRSLTAQLNVPEQLEFEKNIGGTTSLSRLLAMALGQQYGGGWADVLAGRAGAYEPEFAAQTIEQPGKQSYLGYLMQKYGLG